MSKEDLCTFHTWGKGEFERLKKARTKLSQKGENIGEPDSENGRQCNATKIDNNHSWRAQKEKGKVRLKS